MKKLLSFILLCVVLLTFSSCGNGSVSPTAAVAVEKTDPSGQSFTVPAKIERVITLAPAITDIVCAIGFGDAIVAADVDSYSVEWFDASLCVLQMYPPDAETILSYEPDIVFVSGLSQVGDDDPYKMLKDAGVSVAYIPSSDSIAGIYSDIEFYGKVLGKETEATALIDGMKTSIAEISAIGETIIGKKTVLFEISASPFIYSFGSGVFINEMIEIIGAKNAIVGETGWIAVADEVAVALNPDVILTSVNYIDDPVAEILSRAAFSEVTAIVNNDVYLIDPNASMQPSHNIIKALKEIAEAVYPDYYNFR